MAAPRLTRPPLCARSDAPPPRRDDDRRYDEPRRDERREMDRPFEPPRHNAADRRDYGNGMSGGMPPPNDDLGPRP